MTELSPEKILRLAFAFSASKTLLSAIELGVFTELAKGPLDAEQLRARLSLHSRSARDFFDALLALGMLQRENGRYANTPETDLFLDRSKPTYLGGVLEMTNERLYPYWGSLTEGLRTGRPQNEAKQGGSLFDMLSKDPERLRLFMAAMTAFSTPTAKALAQKFPWGKYRTMIDVGGAQGALPAHVAQAHPHITGGVFDLPMVEPLFNEHVASFGLDGRMRFHPGDFFQDPLPQADVLTMGRILHDWNLDEKRMLIRKAYEALPKGGAFVVIEMLIDDERRQGIFGLMMSLNMLIETPGGFDFTGADCSGWLREAGFRETRVEPLAGPDCMVVGIK